jgi:acetyl-CoA carboxylase carboxyltransferase component
VDQGTFTQVHADYAPNLVVGFARLGGQAIGVVANQPRKMAGCLDIDSSDKGARFIRFCDAFNLPLVTLVDTPGYLPGKNQEYGGVIRHGAKMIYAYSEATVPKITLVMRKAFGGAYIAMCSRSLGADYVMAWPTAQMAVMGAEEAVNVIYQREIAAAGEGGEELRRAKINEYQEKVGHPYTAAEAGLIDGVIDPGDTRGELISLLNATLSKRESRLPKKHGNFPV